MNPRLKKWLIGLVTGVFTGIGSAGANAIGIATANGLSGITGVTVAQLDLKQLGIVTLVGGVGGAFLYLAKSPLKDALEADEETKPTPPGT